MELFDRTSGCLTDEGLQALADGQLDELSRLEAAEHLAFCDACLDRYTALLAGPMIVQPPQDLQKPVWQRIRSQMFRVLTNRYATAAAAVAIAFCLWGSGLFQGLVPTPDAQLTPALQLQQTEQTQQTLEQRLAFNEAARSASRSLSSLFDSVSDGISKAVTSPRLTNNPKE